MGTGKNVVHCASMMLLMLIAFRLLVCVCFSNG